VKDDQNVEVGVTAERGELGYRPHRKGVDDREVGVAARFPQNAAAKELMQMTAACRSCAPRALPAAGCLRDTYDSPKTKHTMAPPLNTMMLGNAAR